MSVMIDVLCCTYGRTRHLREAVQSFALQSIPMARMIILNDNPEQKLSCAMERVVIVNADTRFPCLGDKRNAVNALSDAPVCVTVDDDDLFMPWFCSEMMKGALAHGYFLASNFISSSGTGKNFTTQLRGRGPAGVPSYTKSLFDKIRGYPSINSGQDQELTARMSKYLNHNPKWYSGDRVFELNAYDTVGKHEKICPPSYVYRWSNGVTHLSGKPDGNEWDRARISFENNRLEPRGDILIVPSWDIDYVTACKGPIDQWMEKNPGYEDPRKPWDDTWKPAIVSQCTEPDGMRLAKDVLVPKNIKLRGEK